MLGLLHSDTRSGRMCKCVCECFITRTAGQLVLLPLCMNAVEVSWRRAFEAPACLEQACFMQLYRQAKRSTLIICRAFAQRAVPRA